MKLCLNEDIEELLDKSADLMIESLTSEITAQNAVLDESINSASGNVSENAVIIGAGVVAIGVIIIAILGAIASKKKETEKRKANAKNSYKYSKAELNDASKRLKQTISDIKDTLKKDLPDYAESDAYDIWDDQLKWLDENKSDAIAEYIGPLSFCLGYIDVKKYAQHIKKYNEMVITQESAKEFIRNEAKKLRDIILKCLKKNIAGNDLLEKHSGLYLECPDDWYKLSSWKKPVSDSTGNYLHGSALITLHYITDSIVRDDNPIFNK